MCYQCTTSPPSGREISLVDERVTRPPPTPKRKESVTVFWSLPQDAAKDEMQHFTGRKQALTRKFTKRRITRDEPCSDTFAFLDLVKKVFIQSISPLLEMVTLNISSSSSALWWYKPSDDPLQVFDDPKRISIGNMDFDNPKVYGDTSIFDDCI